MTNFDVERVDEVRVKTTLKESRKSKERIGMFQPFPSEFLNNND